MSKWVTLGYQWTCRDGGVPGCEDIPQDEVVGTTGWENPSRGVAVAAAALRHRQRTGHAVSVDRHQERMLPPVGVKPGA